MDLPWWKFHQNSNISLTARPIHIHHARKFPCFADRDRDGHHSILVNRLCWFSINGADKCRIPGKACFVVNFMPSQIILYNILCWSKELRKSGEIKATKWMKTGKFPGKSNADIKARNLLQSVGNFAAIVQPSFNRPMMSWLMLPGVATVIPSFIIVSLDRFWCCSTHYIYTLQIHGVGVGPLC